MFLLDPSNSLSFDRKGKLADNRCSRATTVRNRHRLRRTGCERVCAFLALQSAWPRMGVNDLDTLEQQFEDFEAIWNTRAIPYRRTEQSIDSSGHFEDFIVFKSAIEPNSAFLGMQDRYLNRGGIRNWVPAEHMDVY